MIARLFARAAGISLIASTVLLAAACKGSPTATDGRYTSGGAAPAAVAAPATGPVAAPRSAPVAPAVAYPASPPVASPVSPQAQRGAGLFAQSCAKCHGGAGEGTAQAPALIGRGALPTSPPANRRLRTGTFSTAKDIGMFVKDNMPPGSRTPPDQTGAILAFLLQSNGVQTNGDMNPSTAASVLWQR